MKNILIVGLGSIGRRHLSHFVNYFDIVDVVDINENRLKQEMKYSNVKNAYLNYQDALNENSYDVVAITTPPHMHLPIAQMAVARGSNLFIEKPIGLYINGWAEVSNLCVKNSLKAYVAYCHLHIKYTKRLKEIIKQIQGKNNTPFSASSEGMYN